MILLLVITLITGEVFSRPVPAKLCPALAAQVIQQQGVASAACWAEAHNLRPVFSTVAS